MCVISQASVNPDEIELDADEAAPAPATHGGNAHRGRGGDDLDVMEQAVPDAVFGDAKKVLAQQQQEKQEAVGALARFKKSKQ